MVLLFLMWLKKQSVLTGLIFKNDIFNKTRSKLLQYKTLIQKRKLMVEIGVNTRAAGWTSGDLDSGIIINQQELELFLHFILRNFYFAAQDKYDIQPVSGTNAFAPTISNSEKQKLHLNII